MRTNKSNSWDFSLFSFSRWTHCAEIFEPKKSVRHYRHAFCGWIRNDKHAQHSHSTHSHTKTPFRWLITDLRVASFSFSYFSSLAAHHRSTSYYSTHCETAVYLFLTCARSKIFCINQLTKANFWIHAHTYVGARTTNTHTYTQIVESSIG